MLYPQNVPKVERVSRMVLGLAFAGMALFSQSLFGTSSPLLIGILLFSAGFVIVTGFIGCGARRAP